MRILYFLVFMVFVSLIFAEDKPGNLIVNKLTDQEMLDGPQLSAESVYPGWGTICTNFTYRVVYRDEKNRPPEYVRIWLNGKWHNMNQQSGDYKNGALYTYNYVPTSGNSLFYYFEASNGQGKARAAIIDSPNQGPMIYSNKFNNNQILVFNKDSSDPLWVFDTGYDAVSSVAISKDGRYVAATTSRSIYLFSIDSNEPLQRFCISCDAPKMSVANFGGVAISEDGTYFAGTIEDKLFFFERGSESPLWTGNIESGAIGIDMSDDGKYVAVGVANAGPKGDSIFFFSRDNSTPLWEYKAVHPEYVQTGNFYRPDMTPDSEYIAISTGCPDRRAYLFSKTGNVLFRSQQLTTDSPVHKSAISDDGSLIAYSADHMNGKEIVFLFNNHGEKLWSFSSSEDATARAVSISANGNYIAAGTMGGRIYLFSKSSNQPLWTYAADEQYAKIGDVKLSSDGSYLVAGGTTKKVYLFSKRSSIPVWEYDAGTWINAVDFNDDYIVAGTGLMEYLYEGNDVSINDVTCDEIIQPPPIESTGFGTGDSVCGNSMCEPGNGENSENCRQDCMASGSDNNPDNCVGDCTIYNDNESVNASVDHEEDFLSNNDSIEAENESIGTESESEAEILESQKNNESKKPETCLGLAILSVIILSSLFIRRRSSF